MNSLQTYLISIVSSALLSSVVLSLVTKPAVRRVVQLCCGCFLTLVVLCPLFQADLSQIPDFFSQFTVTAQERADAATEKNEALLAELIQTQTEEKIAEQARLLGCTVRCEVTLKRDEQYGCSVPYEVTVHSDCGAKKKAALQEYIEMQLGIAEERQTWMMQ